MDANANLVYKYAQVRRWSSSGIRRKQRAIFASMESGSLKPWTIFEDPAALSMPDDNTDEERFVAVGISSLGMILVVVYAVRDARIRIISARKATRTELSQYERKHR